MGTPASALFTDGQLRLLGFLFGQPDREFHATEIVRVTFGGDGYIHRQLRKLEDAGLVRARRERARKYYAANRASPIHAELVGLVRKSFGLAEPLREAFQLLERSVDALFVFEGLEYEASRRPPLEMLLVSTELHAGSEGIDFAIEYAEQRLCRNVRVLVVRPEELRQPRWFIGKVLGQPRTWVFGSEEGLAGITSGP